jgi:hypothetical protein
LTGEDGGWQEGKGYEEREEPNRETSAAAWKMTVRSCRGKQQQY